MATQYAIGIDVGGTMIKGALYDSLGSLVTRQSRATCVSQDPSAFIESVACLARDLAARHKPIAGIGIGLAGVIDAGRELLIESPNLPALHNLPIKSLLEHELDIPAFLENDANAAALGELWAGAGKGIDNFLFFTLGTGIGSGLILNGRLWPGEEGKAGEFGHIIVNPGGAECGCGKRGCLEAHSSGTALVRMAREAMQSGAATTLHDCCKSGPDVLTPALIYNEAKKGDALSRNIYYEAARYLAIGIAGVNNLLDIHTFIVGGGVSKGFDLIDTYVREETARLVFDVSRSKLSITVSRLGNDAGACGAAYCALHSPGS